MLGRDPRARVAATRAPRQRRAVRCAGIIVRKRQVGRLAPAGAKRHAHQLRSQGVEAVGLGVECDQGGALEQLQPLPQRVFGEYRLVMALDSRPLDASSAADTLADAERRPAAARNSHRACPSPLDPPRGPRAVRRRILPPAAEAEAGKQLGEFRLVARLRRETIRRERQRDVALHREERFAWAASRGRDADSRRPRRRFRPRARPRRRASRTAAATSPRSSGRPCPRPARCPRVADQREVVENARGGTPNFASTPASSRRSLVMVLTRVTSLVDQLRQILVAGGDHGAHACRSAWRASVPITSSASTPSTSASASPSAADRCSSGSICWREFIGHGRPVRLVLGIDLVAEGGALGVEHAGEIVGP